MKLFSYSRLHRAGRGLAVVVLGCGLMTAALPSRAQDATPQGAQGGGRRGQGGGQFAGMQRVAGEVLSVAGANVTVKAEDGSTMTIVTTDNTRMMKGRGGFGGGQRGGGQNEGGSGPVSIKLTDLKPGDGIMALGNLDAPNKTLHAAILAEVADAAQLKTMRDNLGKTYISGKVTAIDLDNAKMTVERPDKVSQTIGFDETTSFHRGGRFNMGNGMGGGMSVGGSAGSGAGPTAAGNQGESITLADVKVGDQIMGQGEVKGGSFVPKELNVMTPGQGGRRRPGGAGAPDGAAPVPPPPGL